jgi:lipoprotein-anchoring transpeptidase ErfK/SrfK
VQAAQERLVALGYLDPGAADGRLGPATTAAVIAFQKWEGLGRDGVIGSQTAARLRTTQRPTPVTQGPAGKRTEVLLRKQLTLAIEDNRVVRAIHVSTGKASTPTPPGDFKVYGQYPRWWSTPFREYLLWASPFDGGIAFHQYPDVPAVAASHGCVRVNATQAQWLYGFLKVGVPVKVLATS